MLKGLMNGIISLFTSGLILNPMVLIGIGFALFINTSFSYEQIYEIYTDYHIYFLSLLIAFVYIYIFKPIYKFGGKKLDYSETSLAILGAFFKLVLSGILTTSFIIVLFF